MGNSTFMPRHRTNTAVRVGLAALLTIGLAATALAEPQAAGTKKKKVTIATAPAAQVTAAPAPAAAPATVEANRKFKIMMDVYPSTERAEDLKALGVNQYIAIYQNSDPDAVHTGLVNPDKIIAQVKSQFGNDPKGFGFLDYEIPFDANIGKGPGHPDYEKTVASMVAGIKKVKAAFPNVKWTYYGIPATDYWIKNWWDWENAPAVERTAEIEKQIRNYGPVLKELDWVNCCTYDVYVYSKYAPEKRPAAIVRETQYRIARMSVAKEMWKRMNLPPKPIIPAICLHYAPGGNGVEYEMIPMDEFITDQIMPAIMAGADGVAIWSASSAYLGLATSPNENGWVTGTQAELRNAWTKSLLNGQVPGNWTASPTKKMLSDKLHEHMVNAVKKIRESALASGRTVGGSAPVATAGVTNQ